MFGQLLNRLQTPRESRVAFASYRRYVLWTLAGLALVSLFVGLDTILNVALPFSDQLGAEGSALRWIERAEAIATWSWTATVEIGLVGSDLLSLIPLNMPSFSSPSAAPSIFRSW